MPENPYPKPWPNATIRQHLMQLANYALHQSMGDKVMPRKAALVDMHRRLVNLSKSTSVNKLLDYGE